MNTPSIFKNVKISSEIPSPILAHSNTDCCPLIYELIPAHGCSFECVYCNVYSMKKEKTYYPITVYNNYPRLVEETIIKHQNNEIKPVYYFSPKTDVFQPALIESGVTLNILKNLNKYSAPYILVTKGSLPNNEILQELINSKGLGRVLISYGMKNELHASVMEPEAASLEKRFDLAKICMENNVPTMGVIEPILPLKDLSFVDDIISNFVDIGIDHFAIDFARISLDCLDSMVNALPELEELKDVYYDPKAISQEFETGPYHRDMITRFAPSKEYMEEKFKTIRDYARNSEATVSICNFFNIKGINTDAYRRGFLCFGIYDKDRTNEYLAQEELVDE